MLHEDEKSNDDKIDRTQVHAFWVSEKQSQFAYNYLTGLSKLQRGEKVDVIRDALITGLLIHHIEPRMINLVKAYQQDLTLAHIVDFINRIDPSLTEHEQPCSKVSQMPLDMTITDKLDGLTQLLEALLTKSDKHQQTSEPLSTKVEQLEVVAKEEKDNQELCETSVELVSKSTGSDTRQLEPSKEQPDNSPNHSTNDEGAKHEGLQTVKKNRNTVNKRISNLSA